LLGSRRIILEQFGHGLIEVLFLFVGFRLGIEGLTGDAPPYESVICRIVHINGELAGVDRRRLPCSHRRSAHTTVPATSIPTSAVSPVCTIQSELFILTDGGLIANVQVCLIGIYLAQAFCR